MFPDLFGRGRTLPPMDVAQFLLFAMIGVFAGGVGGLLGIGGSTIFIPAATLLFGEDQQSYQATAMILNAFVAITATIKHTRNGLVKKEIVIPMGIAASVLVLAGVALSNHLGGETLVRIFGVLLLCIAANEMRVLGRRRRKPMKSEDPEIPPSSTRPLLASIGGVMGFMGGLLGIGGGTIGVPLLRITSRLPLKIAIANVAAVTIPLAIIGAIYKNLSLATLPEFAERSAHHALVMAVAVVPGAIAGSWLGAELVHRLPLMAIRIAFIFLLLFAGTRMIGLH